MSIHPEVLFGIIVGIGVVVTAFPVMFAIYTPTWWRGEVGRAQMARAVSMAALVDLVVAVRIFDIAIGDTTRLLVYGGIFLAECYLLWSYLHERFEWPGRLCARLVRLGRRP